MSTITLRLTKGSPLTWQEADDNLSNINDDLVTVIADVATLTSDVATIDGEVNTLQSDVTTLNTNKIEVSTITGATSKATPVDADEFPLVDSVSGLLNKVTWANIKATLKTYFDTLYGALASTQTWTKPQRGTITTDNDLSFDLNGTNNFLCTPTAGGALTFTNISSGQTGTIKLVNGSDYAITAAANTKVTSSFLATVSATGTYIITYFSDGTDVHCSTAGASA